MKRYIQKLKTIISLLLISSFFIIISCTNYKVNQNTKVNLMIKGKQITFSQKNHALDNNDNFSPDGKFLCYDTRGTVYNQNLANCKSIEKVEIATGNETIIWEPNSITGEQAAPGVAAVSYHPIENKVIFIHGPFLYEVEERGYYDIRNRNGMVVSADGKGSLTKIDMRDVTSSSETIPGAHRGGTHRHEYSRDGKRVGFTYDDFLQQNYDRTIGYMEVNANAPEGYTNYFAILLKPVAKGKSKPGEIEKAYGDSWVDFSGSKRAFIGKVRAKNGVDYETSLFVAEIPDAVDITTSFSGTKDEYPLPPKGVSVRRLTHSISDDGIVRGSFDGKRIAYLSKDEDGIKQVFVIPVDGSDLDNDPKKHPIQVTSFDSDASNIRWHPSNESIFSITKGSIVLSYLGENEKTGQTIYLTQDNAMRGNLVVSRNGNMLAYNVDVSGEDVSVDKIGRPNKEFSQIFVLALDWGKLTTRLN